MILTQLNTKLSSLFNYLTKHHNVTISDLDMFKRYIWQIDAVRIKLVHTPLVWVDYIFIDKFDVYKLDMFNYKDKISEFDKDIIDFVVTRDESVLKAKYYPDGFKVEGDDVSGLEDNFIIDIKHTISNAPYQRNLTINHYDFLSCDLLPYYEEQRENRFLFEVEYEKELIQRRRELKLKEILNS